MKIDSVSYWTDPSNFNTNVGYGVGGEGIVLALKDLGYKVPFDDPHADMQLNFVQPEYYEINPGQFTVGLTPWESTKIPELWDHHIAACDEFWTTSEWCRKMFELNGIKVHHVYEHGIKDIWKIRALRTKRDKVKILHIGEPAPRKGGQLAFETFLSLYEGNPRVSLTIKANEINTIRRYDRYKSIVGPIEKIPNVNLVTETLSEMQLVTLVLAHDILVYPSWGEGFGFIPLQALATGMPVICTEEWAPYAEYLNGLGLNSRYVESPWPTMHPGEVLEPDKTHLAYLMKDAVDNVNHYGKLFYEQTDRIWERYNWINQTKKAFSALEKRY